MGRRVLPESLATLRERVIDHLEIIYPGEDAPTLASRCLDLMQYQKHLCTPEGHRNAWTQTDAVIICYGDSITAEGQTPLRTLYQALERWTESLFSIVHLLPFFPYSSDDGFSVIHYRQVNESLGDWDDIVQFTNRYRVMGDLVLNHCSARSQWFLQFMSKASPGANYFITDESVKDVSKVVRPRSTPLFREVQTPEGTQQVWCTFGHDQVDLNYSNPDVLLEMIGIIAFYLDQGITVFRLDAVAYLWKVSGTNCVNLPQTHEIVRLFRTLIEHREQEAVLITETNLPNRENLSYFGNANEAHWIYNFTLPPLVLHAVTFGKAAFLNQWMMGMPPARDGTAYLNFVSSHDGIGLRPAEGILPESELEHLVTLMKTRGGLISVRELNGDIVPYELNISLFSACATDDDNEQLQASKFLLVHALMFGLEGVPAVYFPSLFATPNASHRVSATGHNRAINRPEWTEKALDQALEQEPTKLAVLKGLQKLLSIRRKQPAFHPNATQFTMDAGAAVFAFWRQSRQREQSIFCLHNLTRTEQVIPLSRLNLIEGEAWVDLITGEALDANDKFLRLDAYQSRWISNLNVSNLAH